jgi:hypothetical protein
MTDFVEHGFIDYDLQEVTDSFKDGIKSFPKNTIFHFLAENPDLLAKIVLDKMQTDTLNAVDGFMLQASVTLMSDESLDAFQKNVKSGMGNEAGEA